MSNQNQTANPGKLPHYQTIDRLREQNPDKAALLVVAVLEDNDNISQLSDLLCVASDESQQTETMREGFPYTGTLIHIGLDILDYLLERQGAILADLQVGENLDIEAIDTRMFDIGVKYECVHALINVIFDRLPDNNSDCRRLKSLINSCIPIAKKLQDSDSLEALLEALKPQQQAA